jgi:PAS domain-containing protein
MKSLSTRIGRYVAAPDWLERKSWHDTIWLTIPVLALLVSGPAWFFRLVDTEMGPLVWSLFFYFLLREAVEFSLRKITNHSTILWITLGADLAGIGVLALLWHFSQTVRNPLFLLVLVIPLISSAVMYPTYITFSLTGLSILVVTMVAWVDVPQLRSALLQMVLIPSWLASLLSVGGHEIAGPTTGDFSAANAVALLLAFSFGCVVIAGIADRVQTLFTERAKSAAGEGAVAALAQSSPVFTIDRESMCITNANRAFWEYSLVGPWASGISATPGASGASGTPGPSGASEALTTGKEAVARASAGPALFDCIRFNEEEELRKMIAGHGGAMLCRYKVDSEARAGKIHVEVLPDGSSCQVQLEDLSAESFLRTALDALEMGVILLAENDLVLYFNAAAKRIFPALADGIEADPALQVEALGSPWWELGARSRHSRTISLHGHTYHAVCMAAQLPGQGVTLSVLSLSEV